MDEYNTDIFRQMITVDGKKYGKIGFNRILDRDYVDIMSFEDGDEIVSFPLVAVPQLIALLTHAWATKNRPTEDDTYAFPRLEEKA